MALISLTCPTCKGEGSIALPFPPPLSRGMRYVKCIPCNGSGGVLVHSSSITGTKATRVITDDPWEEVWNQVDEFSPPE